MGIRVHKIIGYGFDDVQTKDYDIVDPRFKSSINDHEAIYEKCEAFPEWIMENVDQAAYILHAIYKMPIADIKFDLSLMAQLMRARIKEGRKYKTHTLFTHQSEFGIPEVMMFVPIDSPGWYRYDDIIDWMEETKAHNQENRIINLFEETNSCGIYPYTMMMLNPFRENLTQSKRNRMEPSTYNMATGRWDEGMPPQAKNEEILKHFREDWIPQIPGAIMAFIAYLDILENPQTLYELKPLLYVYWG